jgi:hypothetical protein
VQISKLINRKQNKWGFFSPFLPLRNVNGSFELSERVTYIKAKELFAILDFRSPYSMKLVITLIKFEHSKALNFESFNNNRHITIQIKKLLLPLIKKIKNNNNKSMSTIFLQEPELTRKLLSDCLVILFNMHRHQLLEITWA